MASAIMSDSHLSDATLVSLREWLSECGIPADDVSDEDMRTLARTLPVLLKQPDGRNILLRRFAVTEFTIEVSPGNGSFSGYWKAEISLRGMNTTMEVSR